jgi:hypothetical protein
MRSPTTVGEFVVWAALADVAVFVASFAFFGGAHGPAGPMYVLGVLNAPIRELADRLVPMERSSDTIDLALAFVVVIVNGALYGLLVGAVVSLWRRVTVSEKGRR